MENKFDTLGMLIDELDNLAHAINIPLPAQTHVDSLKRLLPEKVARLKQVFTEITGENPWD